MPLPFFSKVIPMKKYRWYVIGCGLLFLAALAGLWFYLKTTGWSNMNKRTQFGVFFGFYVTSSGFLTCAFIPLWILWDRFVAWWKKRRAARQEAQQKAKQNNSDHD